MNDVTYLLAKSIRQHHDDEKKQNPENDDNKDIYRTIIIRNTEDKDSPSARNSMERLFNFLSLRNKDLDRLEELHCITTSVYASVAKMDNSDNDILKNLKLKSVKRLIKKTGCKEVYIFFMGDDEEENVKAVENIKRDKTLNDFASKGTKDNKNEVRIYCHARRNSIHRTVEEEQPRENMKVILFDSSHTSIEALKRNEDMHPVNYVNIQNDATVSSAFNALVVGFGEVGRDAVKFLYEFGAFVKTGSTAENVMRSDFHCYAVDKDMAAIAGPMVANIPADIFATNFKEGRQTDHPLIELLETDCSSVEFYELLTEWVKSLNYVIVAMENDEVNFSVAERIFRLAMRYRKDMEHLRILVKVHNDADGYFKRLSEHLNRLCEAEKHSNTPRKETQDHVTMDDKPNKPISIFGSMEEIYTYEYVVDETLVKEAKKFKQLYNTSLETLGEKGLSSWDEEQTRLLRLTNDNPKYSPTYTGVVQLRRKQLQDMANSLHIKTKQTLANRALGFGYKHLKEYQLQRKLGTTQYKSVDSGKTIPEQIIKVLDVLAQTEHLRWNASHEINGYRCPDSAVESFKDEARLLHGCLRPWQELTTQTQSYDYNIVDFSLDIINVK